MPSGKVHLALTLSVASGVIAPYAIVQTGGDPWLYVAGALVGTMVTPDLDVDGGMYSDSVLRKVFIPLQWLWRGFWYTYAILVPHRSKISHFPFVGTAIRIFYVYFLINLIRWALGFPVVFWWDWSMFFGLAHVDIVHYVVDNFIKGKQVLEDITWTEEKPKQVKRPRQSLPKSLPRKTRF